MTARPFQSSLIAIGLLALGLVAIAAQPRPGALDNTGSTSPAPTDIVPREGCVTAECHPGIKSRPFLHGPVRVNGCDGCHTLVDPATHRFQHTGARQEMCALCHIPEATTSAHVHGPFAEGECLSCHDPHGGNEPVLLRGERYVDACSSCHEDVTGAHDRVHGPVAVGACGACHLPHVSDLPKLLKAKGRDLCLECHVRIAIEIEHQPFKHAPALGDCGVCHAPHATDNPAILVSDPAELCIECHQDIAHAIDNASTKHGAVTTERACLNCHAPHASEHAGLLRQEVKTLCFECHDRPIELPDGSVLANMKQVIETGASLHGAITQRGCVECHEMHGGGHTRLLTNEYPSSLYFPFQESAYALCFACHDSQLALLEKTDAATSFRNGDANLHFVHVNDDERGRTCAFCHDSHAASREKHIRDQVPYGNAGWMLPIDFKTLPDGGRCSAACHDAYEYNRKTPVVYPDLDTEGEWEGRDLIPGSRADPPPEKPKRK